MSNLAISNIAWDSSQNEAVYALMQKHGFTGLEIAPSKILSKPYSRLQEAVQWATDLRERYGFCVPSMQSIWYGRTECLFGTEEERRILLEYTKSAIDCAAAIGCENLVFGCPKNRNTSDGADNEIAVAFFKELGDYAAQKNTVIGMEANPKIYGTNFINTTDEAIALIRRVDSAGFRLNLDTGTMIENGESVGLLRGNASLINHVHISEPFLKKIEPRALHRELLSLLAADNYRGFVSVEMSLQERLEDIEAVMEYVKGVLNERK